MVRRATFYKYFADKFYFFAFVVRGKQAEFDAQIRQQTDDSHPQSFYLGIIQHTLDFLNLNEKLVQTVLESEMLPTVMNILSRQITLDITQKLKEDAENGVSLPASPPVMAQFFTGALVWVTQKKISEAGLIEELTPLLRAF